MTDSPKEISSDEKRANAESRVMTAEDRLAAILEDIDDPRAYEILEERTYDKPSVGPSGMSSRPKGKAW